MNLSIIIINYSYSSVVFFKLKLDIHEWIKNIDNINKIIFFHLSN